MELMNFNLLNQFLFRLKENFGWSIAGTTKEDHLRWMAALMLAEYGADCISPSVTINLLDC